MMTYGEIIRERLAIYVSTVAQSNPADFQAESGIPAGTFNGIWYQHREPSAGTLEKLRAAGININWLLSGDGEPRLAAGNGPRVSRIVRIRRRWRSRHADRLMRPGMAVCAYVTGMVILGCMIGVFVLAIL